MTADTRSRVERLAQELGAGRLQPDVRRSRIPVHKYRPAPVSCRIVRRTCPVCHDRCLITIVERGLDENWRCQHGCKKTYRVK